ncbi:hypothetical protein M427DRAFT_122064 [Gonapodya prolifera JEL478]|uniref:4-aminobutyrate aminotransferase n=1 Tax=Gonapodya prolifera (strain JEL478) TaxID=1344416 RepID=A0A139AKI7_GONPJ|nr:hypothetical protein M427DRAFT_122064 [Gonapodya prolifera JEL478]|eukprot:KXS17286.1 hypothetical protein M427DRAFT_122064 [Gonapodya prolifera JEL478]
MLAARKAFARSCPVSLTLVQTASRMSPVSTSSPQFATAPAKAISKFDTSSATEEELAAYGVAHITKGIGRSSTMVIERGEGVWLHSVGGRKVFDLTTGIGVTSTGHSHPTVVKAVQEQAARIPHAQVNLVLHKPMIDLISRMQEVMPHSSLDTFFFWNSGAEAVEAALKLARQATKKSNIIVFNGGYHGRTIGTMSLTTSKTVYRTGFGPLMPQVFVAPVPYAHHCSGNICNQPGADNSHCVNWALEQMELLLKMQSAPEDTGAMIIEPVLGEGGYVPMPAEFLQGLRKICDKNGILLVADEVQTGMGRTGKHWAVEHAPVTPDILIFAKGIASGYPLSGIASRRDLMDKQPAGSMGGTYGGNAVACAAALGTLDVFKAENLLGNVAVRSEQFFGSLRSNLPSILAKHDISVDIRGLGLMIGLEFSGPGTKKYKKGIAAEIASTALDKYDMLILTTSVYDTLRLIPPLNITEAETTEALRRLYASLEDVLAKA